MRKLLMLAVTLLLCCPLLAQENKDSVFQQLRKTYLMLYNEPDKEAEFYEASEKMKTYYLQHDQLDSYYKCRINEALYDSERGYTYRAVKKANNTLEDMKKDNIKQYQVVYTVLGSIFDERGNYRMAEQYYRDALKNAAPKDTGSLIGIYSRLADLKSTREPQEAWQWNEKFGSLVVNNPDFYKVYLILKGQISFFLADRNKFDQAYQEMKHLLIQHPEVNELGTKSMQLMHEVLHGHYDEALTIIREDTLNQDDLNQLDIHIKAYEMMGMERMAMEQVDKRRNLRDSLNSNMLFDNINEINAELGVFKLNQEAAREREIWLGAVIILLLLGLALVISRYLMRRRYQKRLLKQNRELEIALDRAQESDRMKSSFIEHVSHEIRTPLNVITGFAQVITNPVYELNEEERNVMLNDISKNTLEITNIVNELLEVAEDESKEHYQQNDDIRIEQMCKDMMTRMEVFNNGKLQMRFHSMIDNKLTIHSNRNALEKILSQLMKNAIKFTEKGTVELQVRERAANGGIEFAVTDTGIGIPEEYHEKVFERFFKVDSFKQGMGLGLTTSRKMAELLGGTLDVDSNYRKGARFLLVVPHHA